MGYGTIFLLNGDPTEVLDEVGNNSIEIETFIRGQLLG